MPAKTRKYEKLVRDICGKRVWFEGPVFMEIEAYYPMPQAKKRQREIVEQDYWHTSRGDVDNIAKAVMDALNGLIYRDDAQIAGLNVTKKYASMPDHVGVYVWIADHNRRKRM